MKTFKLFEVGGCVRDVIMGIDCKDIDFTCVCSDTTISAETAFNLLVAELTVDGFQIFQKHPEFFTIRAKFPKSHKHATLVADFVMARKEFYDGINRQPTHVEVGTLFDDLERRDFTVNAIAKCVETDEIIDPFSGEEDIDAGVLRTTRPSKDVLMQDSLGVFRALRFSITKDFEMCRELKRAIRGFDTNMFKMCSEERVRDELFKMFNFDTLCSIKLLQQFPNIMDFVFTETKLWLKPTLENK